MELLKKKINEEDEEQEEYEEEDSSYRSVSRATRRHFSDKDFKDLKGENRKRRREPKKPWGKKERLLVLITIILTTGTSSILALSARSWKAPGLPRLKIPSISFPFFGEETIIIEGDNKNKEKADKIIADFNEETKKLSGVWGLYVINLSDGFSFGVNENEIFQAASLIKLPLMIAMYKEAESGNLNLDHEYVLKKEDKVPSSGSLYGKPVGFKILYRDLVKLMGKQSDNTAFAICRKLLGDKKIEDVIKEIGMVDTSLEENQTTPRDIGTLFEKLWKGDIVSIKARDEILDSLTDTIYEDWLTSGIPDGIRVAHKYGREIHVINDAGIVFSQDPFVVVIMSKGVVEREADKVIPEISRMIFEYQTN